MAHVLLNRHKPRREPDFTTPPLGWETQVQECKCRSRQSPPPRKVPPVPAGPCLLLPLCPWTPSWTRMSPVAKTLLTGTGAAAASGRGLRHNHRRPDLSLMPGLSGIWRVTEEGLQGLTLTERGVHRVGVQQAPPGRQTPHSHGGPSGEDHRRATWKEAASPPKRHT